MKKVLLILIAISGLYSCSEAETLKKNEILIGIFIEVAPVKERVTLEFLSETQLRSEISDFDTISTFTIRLMNSNQLELSCNECDESQPTIVSYRVIDNNTFEIGGIYPAESTEKMTFERSR